MAVIADVHKFMCVCVPCASWLWMLTQKRGLKEGWSLVRGSSVHGLKQVMDTCSTMQTEQSQCISLGLFSCTSLKNHVQARRYLWHQKNQVQALRYLWHKKSCAGMEVFMAALKKYILCRHGGIYGSIEKYILCRHGGIYGNIEKYILCRHGGIYGNIKKSCAGMEVFLAALPGCCAHASQSSRWFFIILWGSWFVCEFQVSVRISDQCVNFRSACEFQISVWISGQRVNFRSVCEFQVSVWISDQCVNFRSACEFQISVWISGQCVNFRSVCEFQLGVWISGRCDWLGGRGMDCYFVNCGRGRHHFCGFCWCGPVSCKSSEAASKS